MSLPFWEEILVRARRYIHEKILLLRENFLVFLQGVTGSLSDIAAFLIPSNDCICLHFFGYADLPTTR